MKFGIKVLICNLILLLVLFGIGGGLLVWHSYRLALESAVGNGLEENQLLRSAMEISALKYVSQGVDNNNDIIQAAVKDMTYGIKGTQSSVYLLDESGDMLFFNAFEQHNNLPGDISLLTFPMEELTGDLDLHKKSYKIHPLNGAYFLFTAGRSDLNDNSYYLISVRDITGVYENMRNQFDFYRFVLLALVAACCGALLLILRILTRSIRQLDQSTEMIMNGDYSIQVDVRSNDEIGALGEKFNRMTQAISRHIYQVEEEGRRREEFVANFTHELKTPMTTIIGYGDMIRSKNLPDDLRFEAANYIVEEGVRLEKMSSKLFDLFIAKNDRVELHSICVPDLFEEINKSVQPLLKKKRVELKTNTENVYILGDKEMLQSIFINFIDNAVKASEFDSAILIDCHSIGGAQVRIEITDQGCGIPQNEVEKIKEAFYMVDKSRARKAGGAGLGLALASKVLELHQVRWEILSEVDIGTSIIMDFKEGKGYGCLAEME